MRKKELKLVITFDITADAMAMEKICKNRQVLGRLIPIPQSISAGCGLAWCTSIEARSEVTKLMREMELAKGDIYECFI